MGRLEWPDVTKGIGILMVIAGHCIQYNLCRAIYSVHMPLFFFISGVLFSQSKYSSWGVFLKSRANSILKPFCVIWFISFTVTLLIDNWRQEISVHNFLKDLYLATPAMVNNTSIWFLLCLFSTFLISYMILRLLKDKGLNSSSIITLVIFSIGSCYIVKGLTAIDSYISIPYGRLPFKLDTALVASVFFIIGNLFKDTFNDYIIEGKYSFKYDILVLCAIWLVGSYLNIQVNLHAFIFGNTILFYIVSFAGILFIAKFSQYIIMYKHHITQTLERILSYYGTNSLIIFGFQSLFLHLYIYLCNNYLGTNLILYSENPIVHQLVPLLLITFILSPLVVTFIRFLRKKKIRLL